MTQQPTANSTTPLRLPANRVMAALWTQPETTLQTARRFAIGAEVQTFSIPANLGHGFKQRLADIAQMVAQLEGPIGCHGPFMDMAHYSLDTEIAKTVRRRYRQAFDIAETLHAPWVLFHCQYNPLIRIPEYPDIYHEQSLKFWSDILPEIEQRGLTVYLENMFVDSPQPLRRLASAINSPRLRLCLDIAHTVVYSEIGMDEWVTAFAPYLAHVHLTDCSKTMDDHLGLGQGVVDIPRFIQLIEKHTPTPPTYALETHNAMEASLRYLGLQPQKD